MPYTFKHSYIPWKLSFNVKLLFIPLKSLALASCLIHVDTTRQTVWYARWRHTALPIACLHMLNPSGQTQSLCSGWSCWLCNALICVFRALLPPILCYLYSLTQFFPPFSVLGPISMEKVHYCERFIELMIDLEVRWLSWWWDDGAVGED